MIAPPVVKEVKRLLAETSYSQRKIACMTGVSRSTVGAIANGKRRDYDAPTRDPEMELEKPTGPRRHCPGCGGLVYMPCRLCHVRKLVAESRVDRLPPRPVEPLRLEISGEHRARYKQVRLRQIQAGRRAPEGNALFTSEARK